jgi:hypothetical protein
MIVPLTADGSPGTCRIALVEKRIFGGPKITYLPGTSRFVPLVGASA